MKKHYLILLVSLLVAMNGFAAETWNGTSSTSWTQGAGTAASPYILSSPAHLKYLVDQVKAGTTYAGKYFKQTQDFNLNSKAWTAIGTSTYQFEGNYNGNNKYISNVKDNPLFGYINNASIQNVTIQGTTTGTYASLARETNGDCVITNCHNKVEVSGSGGLISTAKGTSLTLTGCSNSGKVTSTTAGGLIGTSQVQTLTITSCSNAGYIQAYSSSTYYPAIAAGGLVGSVESGSVLVDQCFSTGDAATGGSATTGHIIGEVKTGAACTVMRSYSKGSANHMMIGKCSSAAIVKGCYVVGGIGFSDDRIATSATTISCYYVGGTVHPTSANYYSIAQWGSTASYCFHYTTNGWNIAGGTFVSKEDLQEPSFLARINKDEEYFTMDLEGINDGYPILKWQAGTRYKLTASCDANRGTVDGGGEYPNGYAATLKATPKEGCMFVGWSDGNTDNPRTVTVSGNANYTAQFTKSSYTIYVNQDGTSNIE